MKKIVIVTLLSVCVAAPALADSTSTPNNAYAAIDVGSATYNTSDYQTNAQSGVSSPTANAARIAVGYNINQIFAVEVGYARFSQATVVSYGANSSGQISGDSLQVAAVGTYHINDAFAVFGKLGVAHDAISNNSSTSGSGNNVMYGIGGQYNITSNWGVRAEYEDFGKTSFGIGNIDLKMASVGAVYNF